MGICPGARMIKFDQWTRAVVQEESRQFDKLKKLSFDFSNTESSTPSYLEVTRTVEGAPPRPRFSKPFTKYNFKIWRLESLINDKKWFIKHAGIFGIVGFAIVLILLGAFLVYRLTRPVEQSLQRNWYVIGTATAQATLFLVSLIVGFYQGRTATQGGQIVILISYMNEANFPLAIMIPFAIIALIYGLQSDALKAGSCMLTHLVGTCLVYVVISPPGVDRLFWKAWDTYLVALVTTAYFVFFVYSPRAYRKVL